MIEYLKIKCWSVEDKMFAMQHQIDMHKKL